METISDGASSTLMVLPSSSLVLLVPVDVAPGRPYVGSSSATTAAKCI